MSYDNAILEEQARENARRLDARNAQVWEEILNTTDQTPGEAFFRRFLDWCGDGELSIDKYEMLAATCALPDFVNSSWHQGTQQFYLNKILEVLRGHRWDTERIHHKLNELRNEPKWKVRAYLQELGFRETVRTVDKAKDFLQRHRLLENQKSHFTKDGRGPFPRLPLHVPGHPETFLDAKYINSLDGAGVRKLTERYSNEQVTKRIKDTLDSLHQQ